jgi:Family of unknown function (DUF6183)
MRSDLIDLVEAGDLNGLLRAVDGLCDSREWETLVELADSCEEAVERGKQLWPIAAHIDYRIALEGPPDLVAQVLHPEVGRFSHGPLTEVAASRHTWAELRDQLHIPQVCAYVAQERVLRGEDLTGDEIAHPEVLELPLDLAEWEPTYALATFKPAYVEIAEPWTPRAPLKEAAPSKAEPIDDPILRDTLLDLVTPWTNESNGAAKASVVEGDAVAAASALAFDELRVGELEPAEAIQQMAWGAASGGAYGRRRGAAFGRFLAFYAGTVLTGIEWPADASALGEAVSELHWYRWDEGSAEEGWSLRLAVEDRVEGWAAAIGATDVLRDEDEQTPTRKPLPRE